MDCSNFLIWNVKGLNDKARRDNVRKVVDITRPAVVCLQETKLALIFEWDILTFLGLEFRNYVYLPAQGTRGEILIAWCDGQGHVYTGLGGTMPRLHLTKSGNRTI